MSDSFDGAVMPIPTAMRAAMHGTSWHDEPRCPAFADLALVQVTHWTFTGHTAAGQLVVAAALGDEVLRAFRRIFEARFPIASIRPVCEFGGDDDASMTANNSSAFNFRVIPGTDRLSQHALGQALDINPVHNPWVRQSRVLPVEGRAYLDRQQARPGMIVRPGPVTDAFDEIGWAWGGDWQDSKDYQHFSKRGG
ncbi:MAG: M15 family metallopeptidase [Myxococcota bacterium]